MSEQELLDAVALAGLGQADPTGAGRGPLVGKGPPKANSQATIAWSRNIPAGSSA